MGRHFILLLALFLIAIEGFSSEIEPIKQGDPAPFSGYVITKEFEQARRLDRESLKLLKEKEITLKQLGEIKDQKVEFYRSQVTERDRALVREQVKTVLYFVGGVLVSGLISYGAMKIYR